MSARIHARQKARSPLREGFLGRLLDPIDLLSETIFSILILLTFTLAYRILTLGENPAQTVDATQGNELLLAALSATLAWGVIDGVMYALMSLFERGERHRFLWQLQTAETEQERVDIIAAEFDSFLDPISGKDERHALYGSMAHHLRAGQARPVSLNRQDITGALGSVLVAIVAVTPSFVPFVLLRDDFALAIRVSNVVSFVMLFLAGYQWGRHTGTSPWKTGLSLVLVALAMVAIAIPLGG